MSNDHGAAPAYNFLINASNQANLAGTQELNATQINSVFVLVTPYYIDRFNLAGLNLDIRIDEEGILWVDQQAFEPIEIVRGVKVIGIIQR
ncbi:MAG TPA: hypothetical protein VFC74_10855 [Oscillospiraceae bacterium]|nr:hypothetical protein [Oscillospiraceae bacterium]